METKIVMASDLPALEPVMKQAENVVTARHVSFEDFLKLFDESVHGKIRGTALAEGVTHVVCFENIDMWSSQLGHRQSLIVGTKQTFTLEKILGTAMSRLGDTPSRFQYPVAYASVKSVKAKLPAQERVDKEKPKFYRCGICDCYHPAEWNGDCRDDKNRMAADQLDDRHGTHGWEEVEMPG